MTLRQTIDAAARAYLIELLTRHNGNVTRAAKEAGVYRTNIYKYFSRWQIPLPPRHRGRWENLQNSGSVRMHADRLSAAKSLHA